MYEHETLKKRLLLSIYIHSFCVVLHLSRTKTYHYHTLRGEKKYNKTRKVSKRHLTIMKSSLCFSSCLHLSLLDTRSTCGRGLSIIGLVYTRCRWHWRKLERNEYTSVCVSVWDRRRFYHIRLLKHLTIYDVFTITIPTEPLGTPGKEPREGWGGNQVGGTPSSHLPQMESDRSPFRSVPQKEKMFNHLIHSGFKEKGKSVKLAPS